MSYSNTSPSSAANSNGTSTTTNASFTFHDSTPLSDSMASLNIQENNLPDTSMASPNLKPRSCDTTDNPVELPKDIDVVFVDGDDKKLCLATVSHAGEQVTGCGHGNSRESARQSAIDNLMSNFSILYSSVKI